ncbi:zinc finger matrin-type protein 5 [Contarinia nasturtii]|uniref:zinc finger matrin-type protein 5 n=1 Tax=Contarinia nasturtii TaxID=265458 RepID=UPI0012D3A0A5|nr:zinc finger matrin-type protein 5 [Contarinia nasturtii]
MGKMYYCDYCDKRMRDDPNIKKKHNEGLPHQKARNEHYAHYKTAQEILRDEYKKKPCAKFPNGSCQFGASCRFSHYTPAQIEKVKEQAEIERQQKTSRQESKIYSKNMIDEFMRRRKSAKQQNDQRLIREFFNYPEELLKHQDELPPSLRLITPEILQTDFKPTFFG